MNEQEKILFELFIQESFELIEEIEYSLTLLEQGYDEEIVHEIFRLIHSIKGTSLSMGYELLADFVHNVESILVKIEKREIDFNDEIIEVVFECICKIKEVINNISSNYNCQLNDCEITKKLKKYIGGKDTISNNKCVDKFYITEYELLIMDDAVKKGENVYIVKVEINNETIMKSMKAFLIVSNFKKIGQVLRVSPSKYDSMKDDEFGNTFKVVLITPEPEEVVRKNIEVATDINKIVIEKFKGRDCHCNEDNCMFEVKVRKNLKDNNIFRKQQRNTIRVEISKLDEFYKKLSELIINKSQLIKNSEFLGERYVADNEIKNILSISKKIDTLTKELEESFVDIRVYTIRNIVARLEKLINDLAIRSGKKINFKVNGNRMKIDRRILELIVDPLVHIIRNSVDHGIENSDERLMKGKSEQGTITLRVIHEKNYVLFEILDDGEGMDVEKIKQEALTRGLLSSEDLENMFEQDILNLIFTPGFSTAKIVSEISGRGVGMDVVKSNVEKLNGIINIQTRKNVETKITIKIPLTLLSIPSLLFKEDKFVFALPETSVIETITLSQDEFESKVKANKQKSYFIYENFKTSILNLKEYFDFNKNTNKNVNLIIIGFREKRMCLIVDDIIENKQLIIRNLDENIEKDKLFNEIKEINGISTLENGQFVYILDVAGLIKAI